MSVEQVKALEALLSTGNKTRAARAAGVGRSTLYRWLVEDENFQAALEEGSRQALKEFSLALTRLAAKSVEALDAALGKDQKTSDRLRAADIVTGRLLAVREMVDLEERLARLEEKYGGDDD